MPIKQYDVVVVGDLRFPGGTSSCIAQEIRALAAHGYQVALVHVPAAIIRQKRAPHGDIQACIEERLAVLEDTDQPLNARLLVLHNPYVFTETPNPRPQIHATAKVLVAHQPVLDSNGIPYYDAHRVNSVCEDLFGGGIVWAPISPTSRTNLEQAQLPFPILDEDWTNLIDFSRWQADRSKPVGSNPVIGRHSRPDWQKWPADRETILQIHPDQPTVDVRLLGVADNLRKIVGEFPQNWQTFAFNEVNPADFVRTIDFFVYYHHPDWVEGFGRCIAEALAAGAVVILPPLFQPIFREAALYREPHEVLPTVHEYYKDWSRYQLQSGLGRAFIKEACGTDTYLARIGRLLEQGQQKTALPHPMLDPAAGAGPVSTAPARKTVHETDIAYVGDFRNTGEAANRTIHETRIQARAGYTTTFVHLPAAKPHRTSIHPAVDACVHHGLATAVDPCSTLVKTRLLVIHDAARVLDGQPEIFPHVLADETVIVVDQVPTGYPPSIDLLERDRTFRAHFGGSVAWAPVNPEVRRALTENWSNLELTPHNWTPSLDLAPWRAPSSDRRANPIVGRISSGADGQWPMPGPDQLQPYPADGKCILRALTTTQPVGLSQLASKRWEVFALDDIDAGKFIGNLDFFVYFTGSQPVEVPFHAIAEAMARGVVVVLPRRLKNQFANGALYAQPARAADLVTDLHQRPDAYSDQAITASRFARQSFGPNIHLGRLQTFLGRPHTSSTASTTARRADRVLFVSSNGIGLGHLTRLLSVARRMPEGLEPVFTTMSQAIDVVGQQGFLGEYIPYQPYSGRALRDWNSWLAAQLDQAIDHYGARAVVFDGSNPYPGLIQAVGPRADCRLIWMRRGMWRATQDNERLISRQRHFDLIIEPDELAKEHDQGLTAKHRDLTFPVAPIRLLDEDELLDRATAAEALGLDPARPAVLVHLGAGSNRDIVGMTEAIVGAARQHDDLQVVVAEWLMAPQRLDLWPDIKRLRGFPISRYFRAFDFSIGAAGYNSFNEVISLGLPTIFISNDHPMMDDQGARATFAVNQGAAFSIAEDEINQIGRYVEVMMNPTVREHLSVNSARITTRNGAAEAAQAIAQQV